MDIVTLVANTGGTLGLGIFAIWMLNRVWEARLIEERAHAQTVKTIWEATHAALVKNTEAITLLNERLEGGKS